MTRTTSALAVVIVGIGLVAIASAQGRHDERPHGPPTPPASTSSSTSEGADAIPLKDGGRLYINKDGTTYHVDKNGKRVRMRDGVMMEGADGTRYMMKNDVIWKAITERGTLHPSHP